MSIPGEKQDFNGQKGEDLTRAILGKRFWYLERSVDIEGADFLVQIRKDTIDELPSRKAAIFVLGIVQAKFFQEGTAVYIKREYCEDKEGRPIKQFFLMCHTIDKDEDTHMYFFSATDVIKTLPYVEEKSAYRFQVVDSNKYSAFVDLPDKEMLDAITNGILEAEQEKSSEYVSRLFFHHIDASRSYGYRCFYLLRRVEGIGVVITQNAETGGRKLLEARRDVFGNFGGFEWGYGGTGPKFLAYCLLTHLYDGRAPKQGDVEKIVDWLLRELAREEDWDIPSEIVEAYLTGFPIPVEELHRLCQPATEDSCRISTLAKGRICAELKAIEQRCASVTVSNLW